MQINVEFSRHGLIPPLIGCRTAHHQLDSQCLHNGENFSQLAGRLTFLHVNNEPQAGARGQRQLLLRHLYMLTGSLNQFTNLFRGKLHKSTNCYRSVIIIHKMLQSIGFIPERELFQLFQDFSRKYSRPATYLPYHR